MERVPQYIDVEDKIGPFTWKQLGWFFVTVAIGVILYKTLNSTAFYIAIIPVILLAIAFGFLKPAGLSMISFVGHLFKFLMQPKIYLWRREPIDLIKKIKKSTNPDDIKFVPRKEINRDDIEALSVLLDTHGSQNSDRILEILKENETKRQRINKR